MHRMEPNSLHTSLAKPLLTQTKCDPRPRLTQPVLICSKLVQIWHSLILNVPDIVLPNPEQQSTGGQDQD